MDSKNYDIDLYLNIDGIKLIYFLILNGILIITAFISIIFFNLSNISNIFSIIFFVTLIIIINYFILTKSNFIKKKFSFSNNEIMDEIDEYHTIMK
jgi:hypothetical protein